MTARPATPIVSGRFERVHVTISSVQDIRRMSAPTGHLRRWTRAVTASAVVGCAGCGSNTVGRAPTATAQNHVLRVQASGAGSGTVTTPEASPPLSCSIMAGALAGVCGMAYPSNSAVRLVGTPNASSTFLGWSGACTGTDACVVEMSQERTVTATFASAQRVEVARSRP